MEVQWDSSFKSTSDDEIDFNKEAKRIADLDMPQAVVTKLVNNVLCGNSIEEDAKLAVIRSTTQFISHLTSSANKIAKNKNHKNIQPDDVFKAIEECEFDEFLPKLKDELNAYVEIKRAAKAKQNEEENVTGGPPSSSIVTDLPSDSGVKVEIIQNGDHVTNL
ncbi:histone-fold-containing protein [Gigaspora margarita]|uniref:DNA polymerase epsilon subunit D n=2 Tax=Gigaspora margarita TaxID=4874 RepID=A0A8H4A1B9_GIGMA|nr:histone-fold-containing protein [Gigaspora margarita]